MKLTTTLFLALFSFSAFAQLNMTLLDSRDYTADLNDIWGWADDSTGVEYALVGAQTGFSIVSLEDPTNIEEVAFIPGDQSIWRDIKTYGDYAYVTTDQGDDGLLVVDLSQLPDAAPFQYIPYNFPGASELLRTCHNLYIDEADGFIYLVGCNVNDGGMIILDPKTTPFTPEFTAFGPNVYAHDIYVDNDRAYNSEIYQGTMTIYDVTDKENIEFLGNQSTPDNFTHNIWNDSTNTYAFTTDEVANAAVASYDVSDPADIIPLDEYRPAETLGEDVIPHNVHVWQDWLIISYYTDGGKIVDASRPDNLVEVGNFDTFFGNSGGFNGTWGAYPFLPSGTVLLTDIGNGLFVLAPNYVNGAFLEGIVTDSLTGDPIIGAEVIIQSDQPNFEESKLGGVYKTGIAEPGTFDVTYTALGYFPKTLSVSIDNGQVTVQDAELRPFPRYNVSVQAIDAETGAAVEGANVLVNNDDYAFNLTTDANGTAALMNVVEGDYRILVTAWGYEYGVVEDYSNTEDGTVTVALTPGYQDDFITDLGWTSTVDGANAGAWDRGRPFGRTYFGNPAIPDEDVPDDFGDQAYLTQNSSGQLGSHDVDNGAVILTSPIIELSRYNQALLTFDYWFFNDGGAQGSGEPNDSLEILVVDMATSARTRIAVYTGSTEAWVSSEELDLSTVAPGADIRLEVITSDLPQTGHLVEAAFDNLFITEGMPTALPTLPEDSYRLAVAPNPFGEAVTIDVSLHRSGNAQLQAFNALGRVVLDQHIGEASQQLTLGADWPEGFYFLRLIIDGQASAPVKVIKQ